MKELSSRIIKYVLKRTETSLSELEGLCATHGYTLDELYAALDKVDRDKRIVSATKGEEVLYRPATYKPPVDHQKWVRENYPWPKEFVMPFPEIDMSWLFLRTHEERMEYKAAAKGVPVHMVKSRHGKRRE